MTWQDILPAAPVADAAGTYDEATFAIVTSALQTGAVLVPLTDAGWIAFDGSDTAAFLQGQLSSDVKQLPSPAWQYSSYSTPKGRMLATFLLLRDGDAVRLQLPKALVAPIQKRLGMFVLRSQTRATDASDRYLTFGMMGPRAADMVATVFGALPSGDGAAVRVAGGWIVAMPDGRLQVILEVAHVADAWRALVEAGGVVASANWWALADVRAGVVTVAPSTVETFVPQMANMDLVGAVSFKKGCYPGQEIVARTQYLGKLKRRAFHMSAKQSMRAGDLVYSAEMNGQASGMVAVVAQAGAGVWEALIVAQVSSLDHGLHLGAVDGPLLTRLDLPYPFDVVA